MILKSIFLLFGFFIFTQVCFAEDDLTESELRILMVTASVVENESLGVRLKRVLQTADYSEKFIRTSSIVFIFLGISGMYIWSDSLIDLRLQFYGGHYIRYGAYKYLSVIMLFGGIRYFCEGFRKAFEPESRFR